MGKSKAKSQKSNYSLLLGFMVFLCIFHVFAGMSWAARFVDNGDGTVTDLNTGLIWQQGDDQNNPNSIWQQAIDYCKALSLAHHSDWRLPTVEELTSLTHIGRVPPSIDTQYFPQCRSSHYWSSSTVVNIPDHALGVSFGDGDVGAHNKTTANYVRCVRGGP
jgi:hypothetical protein